MGNIPACGVFGQRGIGKSGHLGVQLLVLIWGNGWLEATGRGLRSEIASIAACGEPALEACEADLEGSDDLGARHAMAEGCQHPFA